MSVYWRNPDIDVDELSKAFKGLDEEAVQAILDFLPKRKQAMITAIEQPIAKKEIRIARAGLVDIARKMVSDGQFSMDDIFGQEELE